MKKLKSSPTVMEAAGIRPSLPSSSTMASQVTACNDGSASAAGQVPTIWHWASAPYTFAVLITISLTLWRSASISLFEVLRKSKPILTLSQIALREPAPPRKRVVFTLPPSKGLVGRALTAPTMAAPTSIAFTPRWGWEP